MTDLVWWKSNDAHRCERTKFFTFYYDIIASFRSIHVVVLAQQKIVSVFVGDL